MKFILVTLYFLAYTSLFQIYLVCIKSCRGKDLSLIPLYILILLIFLQFVLMDSTLIFTKLYFIFTTKILFIFNYTIFIMIILRFRVSNKRMKKFLYALSSKKFQSNKVDQLNLNNMMLLYSFSTIDLKWSLIVHDIISFLTPSQLK